MATPTAGLELTSRGSIVLILALTSALGAWLTGDANVRIAAGLLLAPLALDFARKPRGLARVQIELAPRRTIAGAIFREQVQLLGIPGPSLREVLVSETATRSRPALVEELPGGGRSGATLECHGPPRSHKLERVFELATEWPLGLLRSSATVVVATDFVTEPRRPRLADQWLRAAADLQAAPQTHSRLLGDEFHALREHGADEDARGVHALRSAALGTLVRTVVRGRMPRRVGLVVDLRRPPGRPLQLGHKRFEWSLGAAAALLDALGAATTTARMFVVGTRTVDATVDDEAQRREQLTLLAEVVPGPHRALEPGLTDELLRLDHCFWIPAGGYLAPAEIAPLRHRLHVLGGEDE